MRNLKGKNEQGFTLIEVMIAITIFAIGLLAVVSMQVTSIKGNSYSRRTTEGSNLAFGKLEELAGFSYTDPDLTSGFHTEAQNGYTLTWDVGNGPLSNTKKIDIVVQWNEKGINKRVLLTSYKSDII